MIHPFSEEIEAIISNPSQNREAEDIINNCGRIITRFGGIDRAFDKEEKTRHLI
jgi:hypothetical protein